MDHRAIKDLLPFAALDRLDAEERRELDEHLRGCAECAAELHELREMAAALSVALEPAGAQERIWERLESRLKAADASPRARISAAAAMRRPGRAVRPPAAAGAWFWKSAAALASTAAIALAIFAGLTASNSNSARARSQNEIAAISSQLAQAQANLNASRGEVDTLQRLINQRTRVDKVLLAPDLTITRLAPLKPAPGAAAIIAVSPSSRAALIQAFGLPPTPPGKTYELWWITKEHGPVPAGLFSASGKAVLAAVVPPPKGQHVMLAAVTLEPAGGTAKPTGAMYLKGNFGVD
ncbi:MAG: anti-sigma factor domain-containing protein [Candidatus Binataceae bacterium]